MTQDEIRELACYEARARLEEDPNIVQSMNLVPPALQAVVWGVAVLAYFHGSTHVLMAALAELDKESAKRIEAMGH